MDPTSSPIPSAQTEDQVLQPASSMPSHEDDKLLVISARDMDHSSSTVPSDEPQDQVLQSPSPLSMISSSQYSRPDLTNRLDYRRRRKSGLSRCVIEKTSPKGEKKIRHREIERQRRQEMAAHFRSLRSLLPLEHLKGKRSVADHVYEAVKYIKDMQSKIQELSDKRDGLKKLEPPNSRPPPPCSSCPKNVVVVESCKRGVEVAISTESVQGMPLRRVLEVLIGDEGLNVINCTSTTVNGRLIHRIESELIGGQSVDLSELQQKLTGLGLDGRAFDLDLSTVL
ncbi:transcription factor bHLH36-like isoform X2 [Rhodamnia argentea]|uniref:Transcription factor bHLH36-like isoform X2 n=1 Tax=Rhodamnia argentea TaxID=178133 RepID=A0A8B8PUS6_9MYRT|nr:transcription factor bHLH36-like isoform X2 [Rhodamnia argentea]